jgi:hypothetical protein
MPTPWSLACFSSCANVISAPLTSRLRRIKQPPCRYPPTAILCPIIFWRIDSLVPTFRAATTDLSPALRGENRSILLILPSVPRPPHGRKGVLLTTLSMRPTIPFSSGRAAASQPCGPAPLSSKPASAFVITHPPTYVLDPVYFLEDSFSVLLMGLPSSSQRTLRAYLSALCVKSPLSVSPKTKSAPISRSAFPISLFSFLNLFRPSVSPATLPWCSLASALSGTPAS